MKKIVALMILIFTSSIWTISIASAFDFSIVGTGIAVTTFGFIGESFVLGSQGVMASLLGTHTGGTNYSGNIDSPIARLLIIADSATALATVTAPKLTLTQATPKKTGTILPEISFGNLADMAGFIDGIYYQETAGFVIKFSIPVSLGGAYHMDGGSMTYSISGATAGDTIKVYAIDDLQTDNDFIEVTPIGCVAGGLKTVDLKNVAFLFVDPTNISRIKLVGSSVNGKVGRTVEYLADEVQEICRVVNPVQKVTDVGVVTAGYGTLGGIIVTECDYAEVTLTAAGTLYIMKHLKSE